MEVLPAEIADEIFEQIFRENPQDLYRLRLASKAWQSMIDRCTLHLSNVWCKKCLEEIPEICLDDIIQARFPQFTSWQEYRSFECPIPHIAREIYESRKEFPNLLGHRQSTKICSVFETENYYFESYAINDEYLAVSVVINFQRHENNKYSTRIYSINDLTHHIREYPIACRRMDFYDIHHEKLIVFLQCPWFPSDNEKRVFFGEFVINDYFNFSGLLLEEKDDMDYVITKNECFTFGRRQLMHQRWTPHGFEPNTLIPIPYLNEDKSGEIIQIQIFGCKLFVSVLLFDEPVEIEKEIYEYQIIREPDGKCSFSDPKIYHHQSTIISPKSFLVTRQAWQYLKITFATDDIFWQCGPCDFDPKVLQDWVYRSFQLYCICKITIHRYHVLIQCWGGFVVFRGSLQQLTKYLVNSTVPDSRCILVRLESKAIGSNSNECDVSLIHIDSKPKFLSFNREQIVIEDFIP